MLHSRIHAHRIQFEETESKFRIFDGGKNHFQFKLARALWQIMNQHIL